MVGMLDSDIIIHQGLRPSIDRFDESCCGRVVQEKFRRGVDPCKVSNGANLTVLEVYSSYSLG